MPTSMIALEHMYYVVGLHEPHLFGGFLVFKHILQFIIIPIVSFVRCYGRHKMLAPAVAVRSVYV